MLINQMSFYVLIDHRDVFNHILEYLTVANKLLLCCQATLKYKPPMKRMLQTLLDSLLDYDNEVCIHVNYVIFHQSYLQGVLRKRVKIVFNLINIYTNRIPAVKRFNSLVVNYYNKKSFVIGEYVIIPVDIRNVQSVSFTCPLSRASTDNFERYSKVICPYDSHLIKHHYKSCNIITEAATKIPEQLLFLHPVTILSSDDFIIFAGPLQLIV